MMKEEEEGRRREKEEDERNGDNELHEKQKHPERMDGWMDE